MLNTELILFGWGRLEVGAVGKSGYGRKEALL